jgi:hypothetical protein
METEFNKVNPEQEADKLGKYVGSIISGIGSILWWISISVLMFRCAQGQVHFEGRRGTPLEFPLVLGMITVGIIITLGILYHKKLIFTWAFLTSLIACLATLGVLVWAFFGILAVA